MSEKLRERETVITFNDYDDTASVWSASPKFHRLMARRGFSPTKTADRDGTSPSHWYTIPVKAVRVVSPAKRKELTEEQRAILAETARRRFSKR